jgi:hypothetical protein
MKSLFRITIAVLALAAITTHQPVATAQKDSVPPPTCVLTIPSGWGEYKGASRDFGLAFEDHNGTLRFIRDLGCEQSGLQRLAPAYLEVRRK